MAQNISVCDITDNSAVINWEAGTRPADYYKLYKVYKDGTGYDVGNTLGTVSKNDDETYSFNLSGLKPSAETSYIIRSYSADGTESVDSELITLKTLPENFSASISAAGINNSSTYLSGKLLNLTSNVEGADDSSVADILYRWQINDGTGWKDIENAQTSKLSLTTTPLLNNLRIRCMGMIMFDDAPSIKIYSQPMILKCSNSCDNYTVDTNTANKLKVELSSAAENADIYVAAYDADGVMVSCKKTNGDTPSIDIEEYENKGYTIKLFVWSKDLEPFGIALEK